MVTKNLSRLVLEILKFFKKHAQNLNTPQNNSVSWDLQMGFNSVFKGLNAFKHYPSVNVHILETTECNELQQHNTDS